MNVSLLIGFLSTELARGILRLFLRGACLQSNRQKKTVSQGGTKIGVNGSITVTRTKSLYLF